MDRRVLILGGAALLGLGCGSAVRIAREGEAIAATRPACPGVGVHVDARGRPLSLAAATRLAQSADVLLLGETHASIADHLWQRDWIAAMLQAGRRVALGVEYLDRSAQGALDAFIAGTATEDAFLAETRWDEAWGAPFAAYRPIFDLARREKLPVAALNVDRAFVRAVARQGFAAVAAGAPVGQPAPAPERYRTMLARAFAGHGKAPDAAALSRFIDAQTVWDRAMAEGLLALRARDPELLAIGLMGRGHVIYGDGAAHQLRAIAPQTRIVTALPIAAGAECALPADEADIRTIVAA